MIRCLGSAGLAELCAELAAAGRVQVRTNSNILFPFC